MNRHSRLEEREPRGDSDPRNFVRSLERGLSVITAFSEEAPALSLTQVAERTGLTKSAARRFLLTLVELGYVTVNERQFSLSPRLLELGYAYLSSVPLPRLARPYMKRLVAEVHESCSLAVLDGRDIVYISRIMTQRIMTITLTVGTRLPAYCTSMGRVLLAGLPPDALAEYLSGLTVEKKTDRTVTSPDELRSLISQVREQGWALVDQELEEGVRSIAAPVHDRSGNVLAALNIATHTARVGVGTLHTRFLPLLLRTARDIEVDIAMLP